MSVELYPNVEDLDEKLRALEDPALADRILSANPELFGGAAAREEISVFAAAWKRVGVLTLAAAGAVAIIAGYVVTPMLARHPAPIAPPAPVVRKAPAHVAAVPRSHLQPMAKAAAPAIHRVPMPLAVVIPAHAAVVAPRPIAAHHVAPAQHGASTAVVAPAAAVAAAAPVELPLGHDPNAVIVSAKDAPPQNMVLPDGTKGVVSGTAGHTQWGPVGVVDSCTPQGGRIGAILQAAGR